MKTAMSRLAALFCLFVFLNSFSANPTDKQPKEALSCFVEYNDGTIKQFTTLELVTGLFKSPHLLADGEIVIKADEIKAYQDKVHYAISQKVFTELRLSKVAVDALPGFAIRIAQGKLNVYSLKFYNGHNATEKLFVQSGDSGQIVACTPELLKELIKDNADATAYLNTNEKKPAEVKKMIEAVDMYNTSALITKN
jgi:hypothetical protein